MELFSHLENLKVQKQWRHLKKVQGKDFCSNDYLSLSKNPELLQDWIHFLKKTSPPLSSSASRLIAGYHHLHEVVEKQLCDFFVSQSGLLFNSGYVANQGILSCLAREEGSLVFSDELNHASIIDGIALSKAEYKIFRHRDMNHLESLLKKDGQGSRRIKRKIVVSESLFSMDGDLAPIEELYELSSRYGAFLILDEAHAGGVLGPKGGGHWLSFGDNSSNCESNKSKSFQKENLLRVFTFGKAFGAYGAFVACSLEVRDFLVNFCRPFIFSTALPPALLGLIQLSVNLVESSKGDALRNELYTKITFLRKALSPICSFGTSMKQSPILPLLLFEKEKVLSISKALLEDGFELPAIRYPSVAKGKERLRLSVHAKHSWEDLHLLVERLKQLL